MRMTRRAAVLLVVPAVAAYIVFAIYPLVRGIAVSFTDAKGLASGHFIGLQNYRVMLRDPTITAAFRNTIVYTIVVVVVQNSLALAVAWWMYSLPRIRNAIRASLLLPAMMALVAVSYLWSFIYSPLGGPLNIIMDTLGLRRLEQVWLGDPHTALMSIAAAYIWMYTGYTAAIYLSNYLAIPASVMEAAMIDGARGWKRFRTIDWPLLGPALTVNVTLATIGSLRVFDLPFIMTKGGPANSTQTLSLVIYQNSFAGFEFAYGTAIAVVLLVLTVVVGVTLTTLLRRREVAL
ncbi:carbohydrate ABC transporter permease [Kribbella kalugense]|uniref:Carbohydrate ABC transporter membrane protein 1 (CUT1 family) n=1 Tax=Kribbella kalugense TaxID=2512221 RepID=A0A4V3G8U1_9ACTN|nr:sugar ABC transporter permease [Kribbella kalugense]TDW24224.1 carbohydrate ABC transporter membrane protein 1 (CUT1 family) [Kribbella kalugense]